MNELISPKYQMELIQKVYDKIWEEYKTYKDVLFYIKKWHQSDLDNWNNYWENFELILVGINIDLKSTLHSMKGSDLLKIAIIQSIEKLRSEKTIFHGKTKDDL